MNQNSFKVTVVYPSKESIRTGVNKFFGKSWRQRNQSHGSNLNLYADVCVILCLPCECMIADPRSHIGCLN